MKRSILSHVFLAALALVCLAACQTEPVTGRKQLILLSQDEENSLGEQAYQDVLKKSTISHDYATVAVLNRVGERIALAAGTYETGFKWEFNLIESSEVNAFCLPGGKVAVYTGILPVCKNEAGMAAVIAHEVGHAIARHGNERISQGLILQMVGEGIAAGTGTASPAVREGIMQAYGIGAQVGVALPFSRRHEASADEIGLELMARAGYDPAQAVELWKRMAAQSKGSGPPKFLRTHPPDEERIADLESRQSSARAIYEKAPHQYGAGEPLPGVAGK